MRSVWTGTGWGLSVAVVCLSLVGLAGLPGLAGCGQSAGGAQPEGGTPDAATPFDGGPPRDTLLDPKTCGGCHAQHYQDWIGSMHAKAADDPVFLAMNARGQRETAGRLSSFCVNCHAPLAVREGKTTDGLNLATLDKKYRGVTCFFCHSIDSVDGANNADVGLAKDLVMRGEYKDPAPNTAHRASYSAFLDTNSQQSATACGACHDIVVPSYLTSDAGAPGDAGDDGTAIERTFAEWKGSAFGMSATADTCTTSSCHMFQIPKKQNIADLTGYPTVSPPTDRYFHRHDFPAIDVAISAGSDAQAPESPGVKALLSNTFFGDLCVTQHGGIRVVLDIPNIGHDFPSGAAQDRRVWAEVVAYRGGQVIYQSGVVPFGDPAFDAGADPDLWLLRDCIYDSQGNEVNMFWQAAGPTDDNALPPQATFSLGGGIPRAQFYPRATMTGEPSPVGMPDRVTLQMWVQPIGTDVLLDLVDSGDLDPSIVTAMPKFPIPLQLTADGGEVPMLVWTPAAADSGITLEGDPDPPGTGTCVGTLNSPASHFPPMHTKCSP